MLEKVCPKCNKEYSHIFFVCFDDYTTLVDKKSPLPSPPGTLTSPPGTLTSRLGTLIDEKYRLDSLIYSNEKYSIFKVTHLQLNKIFTLQLISFNLRDHTPGRLARFKHNAEALGKTCHPNVIAVVDVDITPENDPYIVTEYFEGIPLRPLLEKLKQLPLKTALQITNLMCKGLHAAHTQGIVHGDLKPENIIIHQIDDDEIETKINFNIAKVLEDDSYKNLATNEELLGTLKYLTPEQFLGNPIDARSDVFGICLIAYEMLSGVVPPAVMSIAQPLYEFCDVSQELSWVIHKGLSQSPEQRQQSVLLLKKELDNLR